MRPTTVKESYFPEVAALLLVSDLELETWSSEGFINQTAPIKNTFYAGMLYILP